MKQNIAVPKSLRDPGQQIGPFALDEIAHEQQFDFVSELGRRRDLAGPKNICIDAVMNDIDLGDTKGALKGSLGAVTHGDYLVRGRERTGNAALQQPVVIGFLRAAGAFLIQRIKDIVMRGDDKGLARHSEHGPIIGIRMHEGAITNPASPTQRSSGETGREFQVLRQVHYFYGDRVPVQTIFEISEIDVVPGVAPESWNQYLHPKSSAFLDVARCRARNRFEHRVILFCNSLPTEFLRRSLPRIIAQYPSLFAIM